MTVVEMIAVAEESNTLDTVLVEIADGLERRTQRRLDLLVRLLEPDHAAGAGRRRAGRRAGPADARDQDECHGVGDSQQTKSVSDQSTNGRPISFKTENRFTHRKLMQKEISMKRRTRRRSGFTLLEVLLVLAILVIMGSTVTYYFVGAQQKADTRQSQSQISMLRRHARRLPHGRRHVSFDIPGSCLPPHPATRMANTTKWQGP